MSTLADTITDEETGVKAEIHYEEDGDIGNPREWDQLGVMYCWHPNHNLGDEQFRRGDHDSMEDAARYLFRERDALVVIPLFLLDHSGISMRAGSALYPLVYPLGSNEPLLAARGRFIGDEAGWDTSHVGFIYATQARKDELGVPDGVEEVERQLRNEVEEYDTYLRGEVFYIVVRDADGNDLSDTYPDHEFNVGGFLGCEHAESEAKDMLATGVELFKREKAERQFWLEREVVTVG